MTRAESEIKLRLAPGRPIEVSLAATSNWKDLAIDFVKKVLDFAGRFE